MPQSISCSIILGAQHAGLSDLRAQLVDTAGANVGAAVSSGFVVLGNAANGDYGWTGDIDDAFQGFINFYSLATPTIAVVVGVNQLPLPSANGAHTVSVTVRDANTLATLADVLVTVKDSGDTTTIDQKRTNASGVVTFSLDTATYKVHVSALPGYQSLAAQTLVVDGTETATYDLTPISVGAPSAPNLCRVYGYEYQDGTPVEGRSVKARLINTPQTTDTVILEAVQQTAVSDVSGYWYFDLVVGKKYRVSIVEAGIDKVITIPDVASVDLRTFVD